VDFGWTGQDVQAGWVESSRPYGPAPFVPLALTADFAATGTTIGFDTSLDRARNRGDIAAAQGDVIEDFIFSVGAATLTFSNLAAGDYTLTGYHNDHAVPGQFRFSASSISGVTASDLSGAQNIISGTLTPITSTITFAADGVSDVEIGFSPTYLGVVLNGFELHGVAPVPEPSTLAMCSVFGMVGVGFAYRRRRRRAA